MFCKFEVIRFGWVVLLLLCLSGCVSKPTSSDKVFSNAQILYQVKDRQNLANKGDIEKASYFLVLEYQPDQIVLSQAQIKKIDSVFKKLIYSEEYKLYVSFGGASVDNLALLTPLLKRAQEIKNRYGKRVNGIQIAYLKNQKSNVAFFRLMA